MKHSKLASSLAAVSLLLTSSTFAADIKFSGFANIVAGTTTSSDEEFNGYTSDIDFNQGSLFALQASSNLGNGLSVTAQLISRGIDDWDPQFEWAYIGYEVNDNLQVLAGRQRAPFFMYSDFLDVSYAYNWITPPSNVYDLAFDSFDGLGLIYTSELGEFDSTLHLTAGRNQDSFDLGGGNVVRPDFNKLIGVAWTLNRDWLTLRSAYFQTDMTIPVTALDGLRGLWDGVGFSDISDNLKAEEDKVTFAEVGFQIDYNDFFVIGEFTVLDLSDTGFADTDSYYLTAGKRFNDITLHVTYGARDSEIDVNDLLSNVPSALVALSQATQGYTSTQEEEQGYLTVGAKWDFHEAASFKFEITQYDDELIENSDATLLQVAFVTVF